MNANKLTASWVEKTLTVGDIRGYLVINLRAAIYHDCDVIEHVAHLCLDIYLWHTNQLSFIGDFLEAVIRNDLSDAVHLADEKNRTALWLYVGFLYNVAPGGTAALKEKGVAGD